MIIAIIGAVLGLVIGAVFGWALVTSLRNEGFTDLTVPFTQLAVVAVLAGAAGVLAAVGPARRASRLDVLRAISSE